MCLAFKWDQRGRVSLLILTNVNTEGVKTRYIWLLHAHTHFIHTYSNEQIHSHTFQASHMLYILCIHIPHAINTHFLVLTIFNDNEPLSLCVVE